MPTQKELLQAAQAFDMAQQANQVKIGKAILSVPPQEAAKVPPAHELDLTPETDDPFGGNVNNRRVAERIAAQNKRIYTNPHPVIHTGDPGKAARDVELSKRINPDALSEQELDEVAKRETEANVAKVKPTPGSPAAAKVTSAAGAPSAPAPWAPNAGPVK